MIRTVYHFLQVPRFFWDDNEVGSVAAGSVTVRAFAVGENLASQSKASC